MKQTEVTSRIQKRIYSYIYYHPRCLFDEIKRDFNDISLNSLKFYIGGQFKSKIYHEAYLIKIGHVMAIRRDRKHGKSVKLPDEFEVNTDFLYLYPNIKKKIRFGPEETIPDYKKIAIDKLKEKYSPVLLKPSFYTEKEGEDLLKKDQEYRDIDRHFQLYESILAQFLTHEIRQAPNSKPFYFSDEQRIIKSWLIYGLMLTCFAFNPDLWNSIQSAKDFNIEMLIKIDIPKEYQNDLFKTFQKVRDFCMDEKGIPHMDDFPLRKGIKHISNMKEGKLKKGKEIIPFYNDPYIFEAVAEKQYKTHEKDTEKNKEKSEKDFKEFIEYLKQSQPHYLGSQELISIDKQLNKIKKKD